MAKKKDDGYLSARESRRIARENRKILKGYEKAAQAQKGAGIGIPDEDAQPGKRGGI